MCFWLIHLDEVDGETWRAGTKQTGEPPVQQYLWQARKKHDFKVPVKQISAGPDTITNISAAGVCRQTSHLINNPMLHSCLGGDWHSDACLGTSMSPDIYP